MKPRHLFLLFFPGSLLAQFAFHDSINGIYWSQIEPPAVEAFEFCQVLNDTVGYIRGNSGSIYEYVSTRANPWRRLPRPEPYLLGMFHAFGRDSIWAVAEIPEEYLDALFQWNGKHWSRIVSPPLFSLRDMVFSSPSEGWIACDYGELWHYRDGNWQQEELPLFIHVMKLSMGANGLYAICKAPEQWAILRLANEWQILDLKLRTALLRPRCLVENPQGRLLMDGSPEGRTVLKSQIMWRVPMKDIEFLPDGRGVGISDNDIFAVWDTSYYHVARIAGAMQHVSLFSERLSFITGHRGLVMIPQRRAEARAVNSTGLLGFHELEFSRVYGMAVLQNQPGNMPWLYLVQTESPNLAFKRETFRNRPFDDYASRLNLLGPLTFDKKTNDQEKVANFDQGVTTGDLNGDGLDDIVVTSMYGHPSVYLNSGKQYYFDATSYSGLEIWGDVTQRPMLANLFDADHDGDLDLFIACQYQSNAFFINDGHGRFQEVTEPAGLETEGGGIGGYVADFDGDGWEDLYVTRMNRSNLFYRNLGPDSLTGLPRFENGSARSGAACWPSLKESQGATIADYDNDGNFDIYVCNSDETNRLLQNDGAGRFLDVTMEAGLEDDDIGVGASFIDIENDGWLDLLVANKGPNRLYRNLRNGKFMEISDYLGAGYDRTDLLMQRNRQFGGRSFGTLVLDWDGDGDSDALVSNYDAGLFTFGNGTNWPEHRNQEAIELIPEGIIGNRSAVGAKVFLYEAGRLDDSTALIGLRQIESASGYGCSPPKIAHFGVEAGNKYDARIQFPSGKTRVLTGLQGGARIIVAEIEGWNASLIKAERALSDIFEGYRSREGFIAIASALALLTLLLWLGKRILRVSVSDQKLFATIFVLVFLATKAWLLAPTNSIFILRPIVLAWVAALGTLTAINGGRLYRARPASLEMLQMRLNAFDHGTIIHHGMNRIAFYAENAEVRGDVRSDAFRHAGFDAKHTHDFIELPPKARNALLDSLHTLLPITSHEISAILRYQYGYNYDLDLALKLKRAWGKLEREYKLLLRNLESEEALSKASLMAIVMHQDAVREVVKNIKARTTAESHAEIPAVLMDFLRAGDHSSIRLLPLPKLPRVRIASADLAHVLDELVQNALNNMDHEPPQIEISCRQNLNEIHLDVRDNGRGLAPELWEKIFRHGFTTKLDGKGGFGLYHARQRLEKFGGKLFVAESEIGKGTTMRMVLKAEK